MIRVERLRRDEPGWMEAVRLVMGDGAHPTVDVDRAVTSLLEVVAIQELTLDPVLGARRDGCLVGSCVGVRSPGRSALAFLGPSDDDRIEPEVGVMLLGALREGVRQGDVAMLQALLPASSARTAKVYREAGFRYLTELVYLERKITGPSPNRRVRCDATYLTYSPDLEEKFVEILEATYEESLDCPGLTGIRSARDVLVGHLHTGVSDPAGLWFLAMLEGRPAGVLLLSGVYNRSCLEVVYMGVAVAARGRGVGDALLSLALDVGRRRGVRSLTLAVDGTNEHACRLYERWGLREVSRRRAWICRSPF